MADQEGGRSESEACEECGFVYEDLAPRDIPAAVRSFAKRYRAPLTRFLPGEDGDSLIRERPDPDTWSAIEYASHVRDVFASYTGWIEMTLAEDRPLLEVPPPDKLADIRNYSGDDPVVVADAIATNAERLAATIESVPDDGWERVGLRDDEERSVLFTARRAVHEGGHHLLDIGRGMRAIRDRRKADT